jgi:hypothetical protein
MIRDAQNTLDESAFNRLDSLMAIPEGNVNELRSGMIFWTGWGNERDAATPRFSCPWRFWGDIYAEAIGLGLRRDVFTRTNDTAYARTREQYDNGFLTAAPKIGMVVAENLWGACVVYIGAHVAKDLDNEQWANWVAIAPGITWRMSGLAALNIKAELLRGRYFSSDTSVETDRYHSPITEVRINADFWYGLGM